MRGSDNRSAKVDAPGVARVRKNQLDTTNRHLCYLGRGWYQTFFAFAFSYAEAVTWAVTFSRTMRGNDNPSAKVDALGVAQVRKNPVGHHQTVIFVI